MIDFCAATGVSVRSNCRRAAAPMYALLFCAVGLIGATTSQAQPVTVYDDVVRNGFANYSFGGGSNFSNTTQHHTGTQSISILGHGFNALSFVHVPGAVVTQIHTSDTPILRFWVNGGTQGGQVFTINLQSNDVFVGTAAPLDNYLAGGITAGMWREVTIDLRAAPFNAVDFDRIDIQSQADGSHTDASATYFDDIVLEPAVVVPIGIMQIEHDVPVASMTSDRFTWQDSNGLPRVASLAHNDTAPVNGSHGGALREFKYQLSNGQTRTATVTTYGNAGYGGFGYVTLHSSRYVGCNGDDSPLGLQFSGTWQRVFEGRHHAIFRFRQNYQRNCPTSGPVVTRLLPVTIDWMFTTGHDNPVWAVTYDVDLIPYVGSPTGFAPAGTYWDDSRAPYGELNIDGFGFNNDINGTSWGDRYKFIPGNLAGSSFTLSSPWTWNTPNTVPFVKEWLDGPLGAAPGYYRDATMGIVQTQTMTQQDAGGARDPGVMQPDGSISDIRPYWNKTSLTVPAEHGAGASSVPNGDNWPYQANGNNLSAGGGSNNARLTWKTQYGFIGQATYQLNDGVGTTAVGYPKKSYSTYIVLGQHTTVPEPVDAQVTQVETVQSLTLSITPAGPGSVVISGPAGNVRADNVNYAPEGYNHVYGALAFSAAGNALDANIAVGAGTLKKPLMILSNYTGGAPLVKIGGVTVVADADYFASLRPTANELWITLNRDLSGATNRVEISSPGGGGVPAAPTGVVASAFSSTRVDVSWNAAGGAVSYQVDRKGPGDLDFSQIGQPGGSPFPDTTAAPDTAYLYRVRAVNGSGPSPNSAVDLATTVIFTDSPLSSAAGVQALHLSQLRTAVTAVRTLAGSGAFGYTDAANAGVAIKAIHIEELRTAVDAARMTLGLSTGGYTDGPLAGVIIKALHFNELHLRVE